MQSYASHVTREQFELIRPDLETFVRPFDREQSTCSSTIRKCPSPATPRFIQLLCLSATALQSRPKQKARSAILRFYFF
jgi:hypothetical protein